MDFTDLVVQRWAEAQKRLGLRPGAIRLTAEVSNSHPHFKKKRGYAVCYFKGGNHCHLQFAPKMLRAPLHRADAIVRHELGHVLDFIIPEGELDSWAFTQGIKLPHTPERRADALALAIWQEPIRYDQELVQSTLRGQTVRPAHLGL